MKEEELLKKYGCNSLSEFIDTYLDCETAFDLLRSQFKEIERLNNIINEALESITYYDNDTKRKEPIFEEFRAVMKILMESDKE